MFKFAFIFLSIVLGGLVVASFVPGEASAEGDSFYAVYKNDGAGNPILVDTNLDTEACRIYIDDINGSGGEGSFFVNLVVGHDAIKGYIRSVLVYYNPGVDVQEEAPGYYCQGAGTHAKRYEMSPGWDMITCSGETYEFDNVKCCSVSDTENNPF